MAKAPKSISATDKKAQMADLKLALKNHNELAKANVAVLKEADKALATASKEGAVTAKALDAVLKGAKKEADALVATAFKAADVSTKALNATLATAAKVHLAAVAKAAKQSDASYVGTEKLTAKIAALEAMPITGKAAVVVAKPVVAVTAPVVAKAKVGKAKASIATEELEAA